MSLFRNICNIIYRLKKNQCFKKYQKVYINTILNLIFKSIIFFVHGDLLITSKYKM